MSVIILLPSERSKFATTMFKRPTKEACLNAIGLREQQNREGIYELQHMRLPVPVTHDLIRALQPDSSAFNRIPKPGPNDWLANHKEDGQTFKEFLDSKPPAPDSKHSTIYILPLKFFENAVPSDVLDRLAEFASFFFSIPVKILRTENFGKHVRHRTNEFSGLVQVHAGQILDEMAKRVPPDSFCTGAITMCDLYPRDSWNFVFGLANMERQVGVYSLARYMPGFDEGIVTSTADMSSQQKSVLLKRSCLLMCHEMCHMFGMRHCIYFHCLMNGSNHFTENDNKPLQLCPVCLGKLHSSCRFDILDRYSKLAHFCKQSGMKTEAEWFQMRLTWLNS